MKESTADSAAAPVEDFLSETRDWEESKQQGAVLLRVLLTNKSTDKDLKVWYRLKSQESNPNVVLPFSSRKAYLNAKNQRVIETFVKVDPTKPYFFKEVNALKVELEVTVRNSNGADDPQNRDSMRRVHNAGN